MANMSNYLEARVLNHIFRGTASTSPSTLYVALFLNNPTDAATGTEVSGTGYARRTVTFTAPTQVNGAAQITNEQDIEFAQAGSNWGTVTHAAIYDALTGGNMYYYGPLNSPKEIQTSDILKVLAGELKLTLA
jgi:hypothetical protein